MKFDWYDVIIALSVCAGVILFGLNAIENDRQISKLKTDCMQMKGEWSWVNKSCTFQNKGDNKTEITKPN